jgi:steroid delta-isomerase-like uncharacterized protein
MESDVGTLVRRFFEEAINSRDIDTFDEFVADDYVWHGGADPGGLGDVHGIERFKAAVQTFFTAMPDLHVEILDLLVDGDKAAIYFRERGTHLGEWVGVAPTGNQLSYTGMGIYRAENGKLVEEWFVDDSRTMFEQIGAIPVIRDTVT